MIALRSDAAPAPADAIDEAPPVDDPLRRLLDRVRDEFGLGPADYLRAERIRLILAGRGVGILTPEAARWLAPVLCTSRAEQDRFHLLFAGLVERARALPGTTMTAAAAAAAGIERPTQALPPPGRRKLWVIVAAIVGLAAALVTAWYWWFATHGAAAVTTDAAPRAAATVSPVVAATPSFGLLSLRPLALIPLLVAGLLVLRQRRLRMLLTGAFARGGRGQTVQLAAARPVLFTDPLLTRALGALRRHRAAPGGSLNVARTVVATLKSGGLPTMRFGARPQTPDYVLLVDVAAPRDHVPLVADLLMPRLLDERVIVSRYDFHGDPRLLAASSGGSPQSNARLADIAARHPDARVLIVAEADIFFDAAGEPRAWVRPLEEWARPVLLTPRASADWGWAERAAEALQWLVVPATSDGISGYADRLRSGGDAALARWPAANDMRADLPQRLEPYRDSLLDETPPPDLAVRELLVALRAWLGPDAFALLQAVAVFPRLDPPLTQHLIARLAPPAGVARSERMLLGLFRLPWLRAGRMPDWLRRALIGAMAPAALAEALAATQSYLQPSGEAGGASLEVARRGLLDWIVRTPEADLDDRIFIETLRGRKPAEVGVEAPPSFVRWARETLGTGEWRIVLGGVVAAAIVFALHARLLAALAGLGAVGAAAGAFLTSRTGLAVELVIVWLIAAAGVGSAWLLRQRDDPDELGRLIGLKLAAFVDAPWQWLPVLLIAVDTGVRIGRQSYDASLLIPAAGVWLARRYGERALPVLAGAAFLSFLGLRLPSLGIVVGGSASEWVIAWIVARFVIDREPLDRLLRADRIGVAGILLPFVALAASVHLGGFGNWSPIPLVVFLFLLLGMSQVRAGGIVGGAIVVSVIGLLSAVLEYRYEDVKSAVALAWKPASGVSMMVAFWIGRSFRQWLEIGHRQPRSRARRVVQLGGPTLLVGLIMLVGIRYEGSGVDRSSAITWYGLLPYQVLAAFVALAAARGGRIGGWAVIGAFALVALAKEFIPPMFLPLSPISVGIAGSNILANRLFQIVLLIPYIYLGAIVSTRVVKGVRVDRAPRAAVK